MATTTNFGWETPDDTDLVKDGAAAIRTLGGAIDTSLVDLKGGTTGQVLAKASNTDMDFIWSSVDPLTILDAKGDLISATAADTPARLAVGTNGQVLTADSSTSTGLKWSSPSTSLSFSLLNAGGTALTGAATITVSGISNKEVLYIFVAGASSASASSNITIQLNSDSNSNYGNLGIRFEPEASFSYSNLIQNRNGYSSSTSFPIGQMSNNAGSNVSGGLSVIGANAAGVKMLDWVGGGGAGAGTTGNELYALKGYYSGTSTISSVSILSDSGNFDAGTIYVYGA